MYGIIYKITNKINGKIYIGQTIRSLEARWKGHIYTLKKYERAENKWCSHLYNAMSKYGVENFEISLIDTAESKEELDKKEKYYIYIFDTRNGLRGYNVADGGIGGDLTHILPLDRQIEKAKKCSEKRRGRKQSEESNIKRSISMKAWTIKNYDLVCNRNKNIMNDDTKSKIGKSNSITKNLPENIEKSSKMQSDRWKDPKYREMQLETRKTIKYKTLMSNTMKGKVKGYKSIYKDGVNKRVPEEDLNQYLENGWNLGENMRTNLITQEPILKEELIIPKGTDPKNFKYYKTCNSSKFVWCPELGVCFRSLKCVAESFNLKSTYIVRQIIEKQALINNKYHLTWFF